MVPPPPGLFSTTAAWPRRACKPVAISRATTSLEPPGVNGTMMRMVLLGKFCAPAEEIKPTAAKIAHAASSLFMFPPDRRARSEQCPRGHIVPTYHLVVDCTQSKPSAGPDRKSTRLNSSHGYISYAVF